MCNAIRRIVNPEPLTLNHNCSVIPLLREFVNPFFARKTLVFFVRIKNIVIFAT